MSKSNGPRFVQHFGSVLDALRALGSSAKPNEVMQWILDHHDIPESYAQKLNKSGQTSFENDVHWAKFYLTKSNMVSSAKRGIWQLTQMGKTTHLEHEAALKLFAEIQNTFQKNTKADNLKVNEKINNGLAPNEEEFVGEQAAREKIFASLKVMSPNGFEEFCARLLRHIGFDEVRVSGGSGDRGVDGEAYFLSNQFFRSKIMFQCKQQQKSVSPDLIRDLRGAIQGRAERGIFFTTSSFTKSAISEATRENAVTIELVDADRIIDILIRERLGVEERPALVVEDDFFESFCSSVN